METRIEARAASNRCFSASVSSAMKLVTTTRGSWSTTVPSAIPSVKLTPLNMRGRLRSISDPGLIRLSKSLVAIISARIVAVVSMASVSSSP
ncbi:hypothetical protein D3C87_1673440 [compost metagenome]